MSKMTIEIPDKTYKEVKIAAINLGISIKDYVLGALEIRKNILVRDDGVIRVLKPETIEALEESRNNKNLPTFKNSKEAFEFLENTTKNTKNAKKNYFFKPIC